MGSSPPNQHHGRAEPWALGGMERHEECAQRTSQYHGNTAPQKVSTESDAQNADRERCQVGITREPDRQQMPHLAVPFGTRHIVDRAFLDQWSVTHRCESIFSIGNRFAGFHAAPIYYIITTTL